MLDSLPKPVSLNNPVIQRLPNGLTIIAEQMPVDAVNLNLWFKVGSALESDEINGMAHFLEHMIFKGTPRLASGEFERLIEERGAVTNAATSQEYTHYYITSAPSDFAHLTPLQLEVVLNASIPDEAFERERMVVLEEIRRSDDNPRRRTFYRAMETGFESLPYRRPVLGPTYVIEQLKSQQMRTFHDTWYQPNSMTAVAVGNLPTKQLIDIVADSFEQTYTVKNYQESLPKESLIELTPEAPFTDIVRREYEDNTLQQARLIMMWRVPGLIDLHETYTLDVLSVILGQGKLSRLFRDLREDRGLVTRISASNMTQEIQGVFYISSQLVSENIPKVERLIIEHLQQIQIESVTEAELNRIRTQVSNRFIFGNERPSDRANLYGYYYSQLGDLEPALTYPNTIQSLTKTDIQLAAQKYLKTDAYGITIVKPNH
ncbi:M16 family metallopeptidase [Aphanothece sacrum]|uniref:Peptidase n=1 Tax=Aphanothece sacrum FPU1 TaxID=1920663 RepID=A0A401IF46_APHSA|nr:pitrilysin family protein [Aphanothece sacrum]GBF79917.1 peptidase [Aphanothece sacrum FPU1]GBF83863.1 peptidase [Aphanothece sacrum FPU3]